MNQELFFTESQWQALKEFAQILDDAYYCILQSKFENAQERYALAIKAAISNLDKNIMEPEFFQKIAQGIRRLQITDKVTVYGDGPEDFNIHALQSVGQMVAKKISKELARTGLWRRMNYLFCYRLSGTDFFSQIREGDGYPLLTVRFNWSEKTISAYDCSLHALLIWLAKVPSDTKLPEAVKIFKPFLSSICCTKLIDSGDLSRRGWWKDTSKEPNENAGS